MAVKLSPDNALRDYYVERAGLEAGVNLELSKMSAALQENSLKFNSNKLIRLIKALEVINGKITLTIEQKRQRPKVFWLKPKVTTSMKIASSLVFISNIVSGALELQYSESNCGRYTVPRMSLIIANYIAAGLVGLGVGAISSARENQAKLEHDEDSKQLHEAMLLAFVNSFKTYKKQRTEEALKKCLEQHATIMKHPAPVRLSIPDNTKLVSTMIHNLPETSRIKTISKELFQMVMEQHKEAEAMAKREHKEAPKVAEADTHSSPKSPTGVQDTPRTERDLSFIVEASLAKAPSEPTSRIYTSPKERNDEFVEKWKIIKERLGISALEFDGFKISEDGRVTTQREGKTYTYELFPKSSFGDVLTAPPHEQPTSPEILRGAPIVPSAAAVVEMAYVPPPTTPGSGAAAGGRGAPLDSASAPSLSSHVAANQTSAPPPVAPDSIAIDVSAPAPAPAPEIHSDVESLHVDVSIHATPENVTQRHQFKVGDQVKIIDGALVNFTGTVIEVFHDKGCLSVMVPILGGDSRIDDLEFTQVEELR